MSVAAVVTADIVNSTLLTPRLEKKLLARLSAIMENHRFEFYRGDSFQIYIRDPHLALPLVLRLRAASRMVSLQHDVRAGIGLGTVSTPVRSLKTATGEAFVLSGRCFDQLTGSQRLWIGSANENANTAFHVIARFADYLSGKFTPKQSEVILELLDQKTQTEVAKKLKKSQPTINRHAHAAGWTEMEILIEAYKKAIQQFNLS